MSVTGVIVRFLVIYAAFVLAAVSVSTVFELDSIDGVYMGALIISVFWACWSFGSRNSRYFSKKEKTTFVLATVGVVVSVKAVLLVSFASRSGLGFDGLLSVLIFIALVHGAVVYFTVWMAGRILAGRGLTGAPVP